MRCSLVMPALALAFTLVLAACGGSLERGARTNLTSGDPNPGAAPNPSRTIDNAGFVDNGGRTSDQTSRPQTSGARATELGSNQPTGTNTGIPNGADLGNREGGARSGAERASAAGTTLPHPGRSPVATYADLAGRVARASCDHETSCARVGDGRTWSSQATCMADFRARAAVELHTAATCALNRAAVATCLASIREQGCGNGVEPLHEHAACRALCAP
jgi:hypothetical protein